ncbi:MAG TPA: super-infection exclusion protein B [Thermoanaerobaculia bacterium]|nr:super-infection exclusion protein B [Thermoanaerobaculia bacterium]
MPSSESGSWVRVFLKGVSKPTIFLIFTVFFGLVLFLPSSLLRRFGDADVLRDEMKAPVFLLFLFWAVSWAVSAATSEGFRRWRADRRRRRRWLAQLETLPEDERAILRDYLRAEQKTRYVFMLDRPARSLAQKGLLQNRGVSRSGIENAYTVPDLVWKRLKKLARAGF